ncbi:MAG: hypothetical protein KDD92_04455 [Caldilineaceae bacterium]|nr:hypothetical protein [Caldilineaceae bacterium]
MAEIQYEHGHHTNPRRVCERLLISGDLVLETPAHFGGDKDESVSTDMTLLRDEIDGSPLLPGTTLAGALRNYLRQRLLGYDDTKKSSSIVVRLFGPTRESGEDDASDQSAVIVDDSRTRNERVTLRDGVRIDPRTRTQRRLDETLGDYGRDGVRIDPRTRTAYYDEKSGGAKFDMELLETGVVFPLNIEIVLTPDRSADVVLPYVALALQGLKNGEIRLGLRKQRGFGQCRVNSWTVSRYDLRHPEDLCLWLATPTHEHRADAVTKATIGEALGLNAATEDARKHFTVEATFGLQGSSLLIRSGFGAADTDADMVHLHSLDLNGERVPVIPGTSWAGVVRHRARRIVNTIGAALGKSVPNYLDDPEIICELFGVGPQTGDKVGKSSKVRFDETRVKNGQTLYQTRVRIDRFTGGAYPGGLFEEAPVYGTEDTRVCFRLYARDPEPWEKGLLLLVLKDLWTGDLPIGGEASVGRGRLTGLSATIYDRIEGADLHCYTLFAGKPALGLTSEQQAQMQEYVTALWEKLEKTSEVNYA